MKKLCNGIAFLLLCVAMVSCRQKELADDCGSTMDLRVIFDWRHAPQAAPLSMSLYLFPFDGTKVLQYEFTDHNGGLIRVPRGSYAALCLNSDTENLSYLNQAGIETFEISTVSTSLFGNLLNGDEERPIVGADERIAFSPGMLWSNHIGQIELRDQPHITLYPQLAVCHYTVEILHVENLKYVTSISGSVSGLSGGLLVGQEKTNDECVTIPFKTEIRTGRTEIEGSFLTFGHAESGLNKHLLIIYAVLVDGSKWYYTYDVTDQIHSAADSRDVHILLDGLPLPQPIEDGSGFVPSVDDWHSVDVDISM